VTASLTTGRALRYAGGSARGLLHQLLGHGRLWYAIGRLVDLITPAESANFFTAAGHEPE